MVNGFAVQMFNGFVASAYNGVLYRCAMDYCIEFQWSGVSMFNGLLYR